MKKWEVKDIDKWGWKKHPPGAIIVDTGNAEKYTTGEWRSRRPIKDDELCNNCLQCFIYCPDAAICFKDGKMTGINLEHCKGCGICAQECPKKAIKMVDEATLRKKEGKDNA